MVETVNMEEDAKLLTPEASISVFALNNFLVGLSKPMKAAKFVVMHHLTAKVKALRKR